MFATVPFRIRNSVRAFAHTPAIALALVVTIAIGVGSSASVAGFIGGLAHPRLPVGASDQIVSIVAHDRFSDAGPLSESEYEAIRGRSDVFGWVDAVRIVPFEVAINGHSEMLTIAAVMPDLAKTLNLNLKGGAVLSDHLWETEFNGESGEVSRVARVGNAQFEITGVAAKSLEGLYGDRPVDLWMPFDGGARENSNLVRPDLWVVASLHRGVSVADAQRDVRTALKTTDGVDVIPYSGTAPGTAAGLASILSLLKFMAGSVFLICCINVASLLLGRAFERAGETSLRVALGATRRTLSAEVLADSMVLACAGGILGLLVAMGTKHVIPSLLFEKDAERIAFVLPVASVIASSILCVGITVLAGMTPIVATVSDRPWTVLQREHNSSTHVVRLRAALVVLQIALCCALVIFATLLLEGLQNALKTGIGQKLGNPILLTVQRHPLDFRGEFFRAVEQSVKGVSHVAPVAWTTELPGGQPDWQSFRIQAAAPLHEVGLDIAEFPRDDQGRPEQQASAGRIFEVRDQSCAVAVVNGAVAKDLSVGERIFDADGNPVEIIGVVDDGGNRRPTIYFDGLNSSARPSAKNAAFRVPASTSDIELNVNFVSSGYMRELGLSLTGGHWFSDRAEFDHCGGVGVVNQEAADLYFGGKPLGAKMIDQNGSQIEIVGVVRTQSLGTFQQHPEPTVFMPAWRDVPLRMTLVLTTPKADDRKIDELRSKLNSVPGYEDSLPRIETLDAQLTRSAFAPLRIATLIALASALAALVVSMIGVFSLQRHIDLERRKVLALHLAFGAQGWRILAKSLIESGRLVFAGCAVGVLCSITLQRVLLSGTGLIARPPLRAWLVALLLPAIAVLISGGVAAVRSLSVRPMAVMRDR